MNKELHMPTLTWVVLATLLFILVLSMAIAVAIWSNHNEHIEFTEEVAKSQLETISLIAETELQKGNYETLSALVKQWAANHKDIDEVKLVARNGFIIASYGPYQPSARRYIVNKEISYSYRGAATLTLSMSLENTYRQTLEHSIQAALAALLLTSLFALLIYLFLTRRYEANLLSLMVEELKYTESRNVQLAAFPRENPNPIIAFDLNGKITFRNPAFTKLMRRFDEVDPICVLPENHPGSLERLANGERQVFGEKKIGDVNLLAHYQMIDVADEAYVYIQDITAQRSAEKALRNERNQAHTTLASIGDSVIAVDMNGTITYLNAAATRLCRTDSERPIGLHFSELLRLMSNGEEWTIQGLLASCRDSMPNQVVNEQVSLLIPDGETLQVQVTATLVSSHNTESDGVVIVIRDITREYRLQAELHRQASHDSLTDLINRSAFESHLESALESARNRGREHILCFMDLDQFKIVNDTCGHVAGDELLRQLARLMRKHFRGSDVLARVGGDEFSAILIDCPLPQAIERIDSLREDVQEHIFYWDHQSFRISLSVGVSPINLYSQNVVQLMSTADAACYSAKDSGRNRIVVYEKDSATTRNRLGEMQWVSRINSALEEDRMVLYAQPIVDLNSDDRLIVAVEVLLKMRTADGDLIPPGAFLPAAGRYDLVERIDYWVIEEVLRMLARCRGDYPDCFINLSGGTLSRQNIARFLKKLLRQYEIKPSKITFEVTETTTIQNLSSALKMIRELRELGCRFALDDFGSGLSSFGYLKNLPVDFLKIDGMFIKDMNTDSLDKGMVEAIKTVADTMELTTIAEFVENDEIIEELRRVGIDLGQGYGIAHPKPFKEFISETNGDNVIWLSSIH
ncbi:MAG: EAL domain-containing protein [Candidatus Thiodiazotropha sp. (ex Ctena orbiculata)]|uniref:EAL domain-containing protein n=1 Tax=Candidatus Thiodiazotropha taylori TaxID=2792791 RepID=A0A944QSL5_9GAMM|nr:EAL domain-containing protein [Candidatus Thiodiazotropha taylori]MBV2136302.1 EAL domain-containing protein [Candidatus Thiodiazotropha taylori]